MKIIVDADACPSIRLITDIAKEYNLELILYTDTSHIITNEYAKVITVSKAFQNVDMAIINSIDKEDILITQDFGLATLGLSKNAHILHPKGMIYTNDNIDKLNFEKYLNSLNRRRNNRTRGPKKRTLEDDLNLQNSLIKIISCNNSK